MSDVIQNLFSCGLLVVLKSLLARTHTHFDLKQRIIGAEQRLCLQFIPAQDTLLGTGMKTNESLWFIGVPCTLILGELSEQT